MNYNTQNAKIASITEKTLIVGIDVGSETHYARAFDWRNYEYSKKPLEFSNTEAGFLTLKAWMEDLSAVWQNCCDSRNEPTDITVCVRKSCRTRMKPVHCNPPSC